MLVLMLAATISALLLVGLIAGHRKPPELRGDWWAKFERDFRAYARQAANSGKSPSRNKPGPGERRSPGR